jgi:hypothetical protein
MNERWTQSGYLTIAVRPGHGVCLTLPRAATYRADIRNLHQYGIRPPRRGGFSQRVSAWT